MSTFVSRDATPTIPGYVAVRRDRPTGPLAGAGVRGGGLLTYVRDTLPFCEASPYRTGVDCGILEAQAVVVRSSRGERHFFVNVYAPPVRSIGQAAPDPSVLSVSSSHFFGGDWNCHSHLWDLNQPEDILGGRLEKWMQYNGLGCMNDGSATRVSRGTGG